MYKSEMIAAGIGITWFTTLVVGFFGLITNYYWVFKLLVSNKTLELQTILLAGISVFVPPIGAVHGIYMWFNGFTGV